MRLFKKALKTIQCSCGLVSKRAPQPPTTATKETIDNGLMSKRVERYVDAEDLYKERSKKPR
jgi:hypothetical protein